MTTNIKNEKELLKLYQDRDDLCEFEQGVRDTLETLIDFKNDKLAMDSFIKNCVRIYNKNRTQKKTITINEIIEAVFCGTEELKKFIFDNCEVSEERENHCVFEATELKKLLKNIKILKNIEKELKILIRELIDQNFDCIVISHL